MASAIGWCIKTWDYCEWSLGHGKSGNVNCNCDGECPNKDKYKVKVKDENMQT